MRTISNGLFKSVQVAVSAFLVSVLFTGHALAAALTKEQIPVTEVIANITLVGLAMIGVVLAKFGIQAARRMIG